MSFYKFGAAVMKVITAMLYKTKYEGFENLTGEKGFILACNHVTAYDPVFLALAALKADKQLFYMAKEELFKIPVAGLVIRGLGAFPVKRGKGDTSAIDKAAEIVQGGKVLGIFPEGTRSKTGEPMKAKSGVALIASKTNADIVPAAVIIENRKLRFRSRVTVRIGEKIPYSELNLNGDEISPSSLKNASKLVMEKITDLWQAGV